MKSWFPTVDAVLDNIRSTLDLTSEPGQRAARAIPPSRPAARTFYAWEAFYRSPALNPQAYPEALRVTLEAMDRR